MKLIPALKFGENIVAYCSKSEKTRFLYYVDGKFVITEGETDRVFTEPAVTSLKVLIKTDDEDEAVRVLCGGKVGWR